MIADILNYRVIVIVWLPTITSVVFANTNCPSICNTIACDNGVLSCSNSGLTSIPSNLPPNTAKVLLINQDFSKASELNYMNISNYGPPDFKILKITIQHSQLIGIASETFSHLQHLQTLDLSFNKIKTIEPRTFEALNLNFLRLDGNHNLQFNCASFQKSIIRHLSLTNCSIVSIEFCTLKPIIGVLKKLILSFNFLKTIDQKFDTLFQRLEEIRLNNNLFQCSGCQLKWLSNILKWRFNKFNYSYLSEKSLGEIFPKCVYPQYLYGHFIHKIIEEDFVCNSPAIKSIDIIIDKFEKLTLSCNSFSVNDKIIWVRNSDSKKILKSRTTIDINQKETFQQYYCMVSNRKGNASSKININWPRVLEIDNEVLPSSTLTIPSTENSLFTPRYSLLELIAAVVSTFTLFLVVFIIVIRYSISQRDNKLFQYPIIVECKKHLHNDVINHTSLTPNFNYQDSEVIRYDWSGNTSFCNSQTYDIPACPGSVFLDFKTHEQIHSS